jgi:hypothetical protein
MTKPGGGADGTWEQPEPGLEPGAEPWLEPVGEPAGAPDVVVPAVGGPVGEPAGAPDVAERAVGEPIEGAPVWVSGAGGERLLGRPELAQVLRFVQAGYRVAGVLLGVVAGFALVLGLLVWTIQDWAWPGRDGAAAWGGLLLLIVLLVPAAAFGWMRRRCRRGARVAPGDLEADLRTYRRTAVDGVGDLADATVRRAGESGWRRPARIARRAFRLRELVDPEAQAIRAVLGPFAPGAIPLLWLGSFGTLVLLFIALPAAIFS